MRDSSTGPMARVALIKSQRVLFLYCTDMPLMVRSFDFFSRAPFAGGFVGSRALLSSLEGVVSVGAGVELDLPFAPAPLMAGCFLAGPVLKTWSRMHSSSLITMKWFP